MKKLYLTSPDKNQSIPEYINLADLSVCRSTNDYINENIDSLIGSVPALVSSDIQTSGRGREGRKWIPVGEGGIYISYLIDIKNRESIAFLSLAVATAVAEAVYRTTGMNVQLKWPNDIELSGLKAGGILIENKIFKDNTLAVIGIGLNVNVREQQLKGEISKTATSLSIISGRKINIGELILRISEYLLYFKEEIEDKTYDHILERYLFYLKHKQGNELKFKSSGKNIKGTFLKVNDKGGLVLKKENGEEETFFSGEILGSV